jgi:hypothetical protein
MSPTAIPASAIPLTEQLLGLVKSIAESHPGNAKGLEVDPLLVWNTKIKIQKLCDRLLVKTMGPLEYTVLLAGERVQMVCFRYGNLTILHSQSPAKRARHCTS